MSQSFENFTELCKKSIEYDPWVKERGLKGYCYAIIDEAQEMIAALEKDDKDNLKEELGDVLLDWMHACLCAEKEGFFTTKEVIDEIHEKLGRRKPYLKTCHKPSKQEARKIWQEAKEIEKGLKNKDV